ncbi:Rpn family recombination-promoting nuclease/putative transposase [Argonema antarcticum]|uniref:Rpn family recombination-promoting nuclease/putative transposase n=1 Tax=Argonema antarcticum TaxID=2942763 RepID=UPI0020123F42|nr:Rpn family recombination-promoting nuclease/putative transposase [Argonema antarcticum]MCL1470893.1 Rpn family recombination-promoting nuclease/putative transposase [Argonema antarcticum A004/B2]
MRFISPKTDFAFKKIFGSAESKPILISFLNALIYQGDRVITDLQIIDPYQSGQRPELKDSYLDVKAQLNDGKYVIIEMQVLNVSGFEKRILYNTAKAYINQLGSGRKYGELNPVISLTITDFKIFDRHRLISTFVFKETEDLVDYWREMTLIFVELPKFQKSLEQLESLTDKWIYFIKQAPTLQVVPDSLGTIPEINMALTIANQANLTTEELDRLENQMFFIEDQQKLMEERQRVEAESQRVEAESQRVEAESQRVEAESQRVEAESQRVEAESQRVETESQRVETESQRVETESQRVEAESQRVEAESQRVEAESQELQSEQQRIQAQQRQFILRQSTRLFGNLEQAISNKIEQLSMEQLINLGDALLDFNDVSDLSNWLENLR